MTNWSPEDHLERALCPGSLLDTLGLQRREYWNELNPILKKWKSVNDSHCPDCQKFIKINMGRHIRLNVFLEVSGGELLFVVYGGVKRQGPY